MTVDFLRDYCNKIIRIFNMDFHSTSRACRLCEKLAKPSKINEMNFIHPLLDKRLVFDTN